MVHREEIQKYIAELLDTEAFDDYCVNGLQVEGTKEINRIVTGVSASERLIKAAMSEGADAIITHHGLFWKNSPHPFVIAGIARQRIKLLLDNDINFFGYHLPLDGHPEIGNNALIAKQLGLGNVEFVPIHNGANPIAAVGVLQDESSAEDVFEIIDDKLNLKGIGLKLSDRKIKKIFILSGGGGVYYMDAVRNGADLMITGELREEAVRSSEESSLSLYAAGHYNSEKPGIRALGEKLANEFGIDVSFIDIPNPV